VKQTPNGKVKQGNKRVNISISEATLLLADHAAVDAKISRSKLIEKLITDNYGQKATA
jgi:hypothetical protein